MFLVFEVRGTRAPEERHMSRGKIVAEGLIVAPELWATRDCRLRWTTH
jgi:hypothetical protein